MKKSFAVVLAVVFCLVLSVTGFVAAEEQAAPQTAPSSGLTDRLAGTLGITKDQATGAAGAIFGLAKTKLSADDFGKLAGGIPEMTNLLGAAPKAQGLAGQLGGVAGLLGSFNQLGIPAGTSSKIIPEVLSFVKEKQGDKVMGLLQNILK